MSPTPQRVCAAVLLLVLGVLILPLAALLLDGPGTENWIVPAQLLFMAAIGAGLTLAVPALSRVGALPWRRALTGVWWGILAALAGVLVFWLLLSGFGSA